MNNPRRQPETQNPAGPSASRRWRLSRWQVGLGVAWGVFIAIIEILIALTYFSNQRDAASFSRASDSITNLANIQRQVLQLQIKTMRTMDNPSRGFDDADKQRAILASQMRLAVSQAGDDASVLASLGEIQTTLEEYDTIITNLKGMSAPSAAYVDAQANLERLFDRLDGEQVKPAYDRAQGSFFDNLQARQRAQQNSQLLLLVMGLLFFISSSVLVMSLVRSSRIAFERSQVQLDLLETAVADRTRALAASSEVSRRLSTILDQRQLVSEVVEQIRTAFNYYHAHIYLYDESNQDLVMAGGTGEAGQTMLAHGHKIPRGRGLVGRAAQSGQAALVGDTSQDPDWLPNPLLPETRCEVAVPIVLGGQVLGVLDVQHHTVNGMKEADVDLLQSIANQVAIALHNARSYDEARQRAEREALISSIGQKIESASSVEAALQVAARELGRAMGVREMRVVLDPSTLASKKIS